MKRICQYSILLAAGALLASSCGKLTPDATTDIVMPVKVGISVSGTEAQTRTVIDSDWVKVNWQSGDRIAVWAKNSSGAYTLNATPFDTYGTAYNIGIFTSELPKAMEADDYSYSVCYPYPLSVDKTKASFSIPSRQDGKISGGSDIMVAGPATHGPLNPISTVQDYSGLRLGMRHLLHILKFYLPDGFNGLEGETVKRIKVVMPSPITGIMTVDMADLETAPSLSNGSTREDIVIEDGLAASEQDKRNYACGTIFPAEYKAAEDVMKITVISDNWIGLIDDIPLSGRRMEPGHATPVRMNVVSVLPLFTLNLSLDGNNLGEPVQKITFTTDNGTFGDDGGTTFIWEPGGNISLGDKVSFKYAEQADFQAMSGAGVTVTYDSEHVTLTQKITIPPVGDGRSFTTGLTVPYLMYEDFSKVENFSNHDTYDTSSTGDDHSYKFKNLPGWTGGRVGGKAGNCIRIAGRRESGLFIDVHYPARVDSAPLPTIKKAVNIEVSFRYGTNEDGIKTYGQTFKVGYVTSTKAYESGDGDGVFPFSQFTEERTGSWDNKPSVCTTSFEIPAGSTNRISWRDDPKGSSDFASNTTSWLYIDDVKVKVKQ